MGVVWLGGAAIRARYRERVQTMVVMPTHSACYEHLREVQADQSDRARHASVIGSRQMKR
jgi:hypothetical protein